ncbi:MAG: hypothetical protein KDA61_02285, partial [Planctomycetales bacterium]|nr:hypothetical protein [Planctomycetales bacterium]
MRLTRSSLVVFASHAPLIAALLSTASHCAAQTHDAAFPYTAYVVAPDAEVRSGPGMGHFATQRLPLGFAVEVYRHDADGMCAIRPPEGSLSLAPARHLQPIDLRTAEVIDDDVPSRTTSRLEPQAASVQVLLKRGERVELLAPWSPHDAWAQIAPPAGEFRWISARHLARTPPTEGALIPAAIGASDAAHRQSSASNHWQPLGAAPTAATTIGNDDGALALLRQRESTVAASHPSVASRPR